MSDSAHRSYRTVSAFLFLLLFTISPASVRSQDDGSSQWTNPVVVLTAVQILNNLTENLITSNAAKKLDFCINDPETDWNGAFNFSSNVSFVASCFQYTGGNALRRLCTAAELDFYFRSFYEGNGFLEPNKNCNLTSWDKCCEPGWTCTAPESEEVDLKESKEIPSRTVDPLPCCEGFFCPRGLTCMIREYLHSLLGVLDTTVRWQFTVYVDYLFRCGKICW